MCGIFGFTANNIENKKLGDMLKIIKELYVLSESRGKESAGAAVYNPQTEEISVYKRAIPASRMIKTSEFHGYMKAATKGIFNISSTPKHFAFIGHSRLVTNGSQSVGSNNQPVVKDNIVGIHNGIVINIDEMWSKVVSSSRQYEVDTEVLLSLTRQELEATGSVKAAISRTYGTLEGMASTAFLFDNIGKLVLATNTGSLYYLKCNKGNAHIFASEKSILERLSAKRRNLRFIDEYDIVHVRPGHGIVIDIASQNREQFAMIDCQRNMEQDGRHRTRFKIQDLSDKCILSPTVTCNTVQDSHMASLLEYNQASIKALQRCTCCLLPETFPFMEFDQNGVCNYCRNYKKIRLHSRKELDSIADKYRKSNEEADCLVTFSGGRDSSFGLHFVKKNLKMNPIAYTYDWGMVTDLARRNQSRLCGKLGVEHILVSADINKKRANIKKNVAAWLKHPNLGTIPLFMAGDKQYFYYANKLGKQNKTDLVILCENPLEKTDFKAGFCGVKPNFDGKNIYSLSMKNKIRMLLYYIKQFILNPAYLNASMLDTFRAFVSYYFIPHNYLNIFKYIMWDEKEVESTLLNGYDWEVSPDTPSTWRIGDGTAAFYNYIYYTVAGFSENDTFRSNQIREGMITRNAALELSYKENYPRYDSIKWYLDTIGLEYESTIKIINSIPKLYKVYPEDRLM